MYIQICVVKDNSRFICWVEENKKIQKGAKIKFTDIDGFWEITSVYNMRVKNPYIRNQIFEIDEDF